MELSTESDIFFSYLNKIQSWVNTLRDHVISDLENNIPLQEDMQKCFDLYSDLKKSIKTDNIGNEYKTMPQSKKKRNHSCWFM